MIERRLAMSGIASKQDKSEKHHEEEDPVLMMLGVGKQLWEQESGDEFVDRLRSESTEVPVTRGQEPSDQRLTETVWSRIESHQGETFHTATGKPLTYQVEGAGIWFSRDGRRINRKLTRSQVDIAISRCPLTSTTEIKDLMDYAYLFALLIDRRIRGEAW
jgi:hypothetical protein